MIRFQNIYMLLLPRWQTNTVADDFCNQLFQTTDNLFFRRSRTSHKDLQRQRAKSVSITLQFQRSAKHAVMNFVKLLCTDLTNSVSFHTSIIPLARAAIITLVCNSLVNTTSYYPAFHNLTAFPPTN